MNRFAFVLLLMIGLTLSACGDGTATQTGGETQGGAITESATHTPDSDATDGDAPATESSENNDPAGDALADLLRRGMGHGS